MRSFLGRLWLALADVVSARRESGAGDGNRTHVIAARTRAQSMD